MSEKIKEKVNQETDRKDSIVNCKMIMTGIEIIHNNDGNTNKRKDYK